MATNYPGALDNDSTVGGGSKPAASTALDASGSGHPVHSAMHQNVGDAIEQIQTKLGTGASTPTANKALVSNGTASEWGQITAAMIASGQSPTFTNITGTLLTNAQTNITQVGTLDDLTVTGVIDANGVVKITDGSEASPALTFDADEDTGIYRSAANTMVLVAGGNGSAVVENTSFSLDLGVGFYAWPGTGTGNDAEWVATGYGNYYLVRNSSLRAEKENIQDPGNELTADMIDQVEPKLWNRIHSPGIPEIGPIAEDMEAISPHLGAHGFNEDGTTFLTGINKTTYLSLLVLAVKDLRTQVANLTTRLQALEG